MNDPSCPEAPKPGTFAARFLAIRTDMEHIAKLCTTDGSYGCARAALDAAEAINKVWETFPIESEEFEWESWNPTSSTHS